MKKAAPKFLLIFLQILIVSSLQAQNLAPNYSFENYSQCPFLFGQIEYLDDWYNPASATPDYFNSCANGGLPDVPNNFVGYQEALTGEGYVGIYVHFDGTNREYVQAELTEPLIAGQCYYIEMFTCATLSAWACHGINHVGIYLSPSPPSVEPSGKILVNPQLYYTDVVNDTVNWTPLNGTYIAEGGEQYITIGNFFEPGNYEIELLGSGCLIDRAYYYIENVKVEPILNEELNIEAHICEGECYTYLGNQYCNEGTYELPVNEDCYNVVNLTVSFDGPSTIALIEELEVLNCDVFSILLDASGSSSGPAFAYDWAGPNNFTSEEQNPEVFDPGVYTLIVSGGGLCPSEASIEVFEDMIPPDIAAEVDGIIDCNNPLVTLNGSSNTPGVSYHWTGPGLDLNTQSASASQSGNFTLVVTAPNGCTSIEAVFVLDDLEPPDIFAEVIGSLDCNTSSVTLSGSSATPGASFHWFGQEVDTNDPLTSAGQPGFYLLTVTSPNGCTSSQEVFVADESDQPDISAEVVVALDCNNPAVTLSGSSVTLGATFHWTGPDVDSNDPVTLADQPGVYTLTVTAPNGCTSTEEVEVIEENTPIELEVVVSGMLDCENDTITLTGNANAPNAVFEWTGPGGTQNEPEIEVTEPGEYTLLVSNGSGCTADTTILVEQNIYTPQALIELPDTLNCIIYSAGLDASGSSGSGTLDFEWQNAGGDILGTDSVLNVNIPGTYTLILTDSENGCSEQSAVQVFEDIAAPLAVAEVEGELTCQDDLATLNGSASTGGELDFQWSDSNGDVISTDTSTDVSTPGIYSLLVTDIENGCTATSEIEVASNVEVPTAIAETEDILDCNNVETTLDGSGSEEGTGIFYEWQNPTGDSISNTLQTTATAPGIYTLIVFNDENGCSASAQVEVFQNTESPQASAGQDQLITCDEPLAMLDGSGSAGQGNLIFEWTNSENEIVGDSTTLETEQPGIFILTIIAENGCTSSDEAEIALDTNIPIADTGTGGTLGCEVATLNLGGSETSSGPGIVYQWLDENNLEIATTVTTEVASPGVYTLVVSNTENNCIVSAEIEIFQNIETPVADAGAPFVLNCLQTEITLDGSQSSSGQQFNYQWFNSQNQVISTAISTPVSEPGTYILIVTNTENNCTAESEVAISQNIDTPLANTGNNGVLTCDVNEIPLDGSNSSGNNLSFEWFNQSQISVGNEAIIEVSQPGIYTLIVTDTESGCTDQSTIEVIPDENLPTAVASADGILTCEISELNLDGSASTSISGNTGFEWLDDEDNTISTTENAVATTPGIYTLIVTDTENGCSITTTLQVAQDIQPPIAEAGENQILICGQTNLTLDASGSTGQNLSFEWQDEDGIIISNSATATVFSSGIFFLIVINTENGCSATDSLEIIPDINLPTADAGNGGTLTCNLTQIMLDGSASSTGPNIEYQWQNSNGDIIATTQTTTTNLPGTYTLYVLDTDNNCQAQDEVVVLQNIEMPDPQIDFVDNQQVDCNNLSVVLDANDSSPFGQLSFLWTTLDGNIENGNDSPNPEINAQGTYTLTVTNQLNGCTAAQDIFIEADNTLPTAVTGDPGQLTCVIENVLLDGSGSSAGQQFSYQWQDANSAIIGTEIQLSVSLPGTYTFTVTNLENGCESQVQVEVFENTENTLAVANALGQFDCVTESVTLSGSGSSTGSQIIYNWTGNGTIDDPASLEPTVYEPGVYTIIVTNLENGCTQTAQTTVGEDEDVPTAADIQAVDPACFGDLASIAILSVSGGESPYLYAIDGGENFSTSGIFIGLSPGTYEILIQDAKGCEYEDVVVIEPPLPVNVSLEPEVEVELGDDYRIEVLTNIPLSEIDTIIWSPVTGLSCTNCLNPTVENVIDETEYSITIIDENGCQASDRILLRVDKTREVYIPNTFSPNDDGTNDLFLIFANADKIKQVNTFRIFDRWGEMVFEADGFLPNDPAFGWDGKLNNEKLNPAVFVYFAEIEFIDGLIRIYKGDVALVK